MHIKHFYPASLNVVLNALIEQKTKALLGQLFPKSIIFSQNLHITGFKYDPQTDASTGFVQRLAGLESDFFSYYQKPDLVILGPDIDYMPFDGALMGVKSTAPPPKRFKHSYPLGFANQKAQEQLSTLPGYITGNPIQSHFYQPFCFAKDSNYLLILPDHNCQAIWGLVQKWAEHLNKKPIVLLTDFTHQSLIPILRKERIIFYMLFEAQSVLRLAAQAFGLLTFNDLGALLGSLTGTPFYHVREVSDTLLSFQFNAVDFESFEQFIRESQSQTKEWMKDLKDAVNH